MIMQIMEASKQWTTRPYDERFLTLDDLKAAVSQRRRESWTAAPRVADLRAVPVDNNGLVLECDDPTHGDRRQLVPTHWAFGQLAQYAQAPAAYLRTLPAELAAINLQWGLERNPMRETALVLARSNGENSMRAITSTTYGRIWDIEVVNAVERVNASGQWQIPAASYATTNPKRATTLYASDRDVFIFLVDPNHPIEIPGKSEPMFRGFFTWNSETGSAVFGLTTFLYDRVCDNRIIWGATDVRELRIRHTGGAPERFAYEGARYLNRYANEATAGIVQQITAAQTREIPLDKDEPKNSVANWLKKRGFTGAVAKAAQTQVEADGGGRSVWDVVSGVTAYARSIPHTNDRVDIETKAGKLMAFASV
jgi:hypothetical protein